MRFPFRRKAPEVRPPLTRRVRELEILSARMIRAGFAGDYHSAFHGRGIEFSQVREYQPGDDIRTIDWNVTARSGVPHVKQFIEERDLTVIIAVDVSPSMGFGSVDWRKADIAAELVSVFAFSAVENADRVGLLLFADKMRQFIPPGRGRFHAQVIVRAAVDAALHGGQGSKGEVRGSKFEVRNSKFEIRNSDPVLHTDLEPAARFLDRVSAKRAVVILISDFLDFSFERPLSRLNRKHDVVAIAINDPREERVPAGGLIRLVDSESGEARLVDLRSTDVGRRAVARRLQLERRFRNSGVDWVPVSTAMPYDRDLPRFFRERVARSR